MGNHVEENIDRITAMRLGLETSTHVDWNHEGGNVDAFRAEGDATFPGLQSQLLAVSSVEKQRNPSLLLADIEQKMLASYGYPASPGVMWLEQGLVDDDLPWLGPVDMGLGEPVYTFGTGGHVDEV